MATADFYDEYMDPDYLDMVSGQTIPWTPPHERVQDPNPYDPTRTSVWDDIWSGARDIFSGDTISSTYGRGVYGNSDITASIGTTGADFNPYMGIGVGGVQQPTPQAVQSPTPQAPTPNPPSVQAPTPQTATPRYGAPHPNPPSVDGTGGGGTGGGNGGGTGGGTGDGGGTGNGNGNGNGNGDGMNGNGTGTGDGNFNYNYTFDRPEFRTVTQDMFQGPYARNYPGEIGTTLDAQYGLMPNMLAGEQEFSADWLNLNQDLLQQGVNRGLNTVGGAAGTFQGVGQGLDTSERTGTLQDVQSLQDIYSQIQENKPYLGEMNQQIFGMQGQGAFDPASAREVGQTGLEGDLYGTARNVINEGLSPWEERDLTQGVREAYADRGIERSNPAITDEATQRVLANQGRRMENRNFARGVQGDIYGRLANNQGQVNRTNQFNSLYGMQGEGMDRDFALQSGQYFDQQGGDPFRDIASIQSDALPTALGYYGQQQGINQQAGPRYFDPHSPYAQGVYAGNQQTRLGLDMAANNADSDLYGSLIGAGGQIGAQLPWGDIFDGIGDIFGL